MRLHLGVVDMPYAQPPAPARKGRKPKAASGTQTTGDVAGYLESKYHVMEVFFHENADGIAKSLEHSVAGALENLLMGAPRQANAFDAATSAIEDRFRKFLSNKEMDRLGFPGVPTQASLDGISSRFKRRRGPPRPSFIDTGLYQTNFTAWID